eukprot:CAMPEP_0184653416 /NCGR_PEP_ID=MMETSP0308-20130426/11129_1 /TAXON_ID=38269 /ORGANISM="Gloeochaete witrockiana, Strain SAG 46.84" /LENGTH=260 /DNA_ID=CAMNT_0027088855 /DNA_START=733 /DNA_END=1515 /DNA_ORIENTATION=-
MEGVENFDMEDYSLVPLPIQVWGPLVYVFLGPGSPPQTVAQMMASAGSYLDLEGLHFWCQRQYTVNANWKCIVDNYLDGGYHVPFLHKGLGAELDSKSYETILVEGEGASIQRCDASEGISDREKETDDVHVPVRVRVSGTAVYACVYPYIMINRYGSIMDINRIVPVSANETTIIYDYFATKEFLSTDPEFLSSSLESSDRVQQEDTAICESVQAGLRSGAFLSGRYAPRVEHAVHQFHHWLAKSVVAAVEKRTRNEKI